jgi:hypothetical protein
MNSIQRHLTYANVTATLALVFSMAGGALAAKHYLITSVKQIKPSVVRQLQHRGPRGPAGPRGATGAQGNPDTPGAEGKPGPEGAAGFTGAEIATLKSLLPYVKFAGAGVGGKPTIQFSGVNVQIVNGEGETETTNGSGNLVIGYDENTGEHAQTGSHDLILGVEQTFTGFGGLVAGKANKIEGPFTSVAGGLANTAGTAYGSVTGGVGNEAAGVATSVTGGGHNVAGGLLSAIAGGEHNSTPGEGAWVGGGEANEAAASFSSIFGGKGLSTKASFEAIP